jgi:hypothetical protein
MLMMMTVTGKVGGMTHEAFSSGLFHAFDEVAARNSGEQGLVRTSEIRDNDIPMSIGADAPVRPKWTAPTMDEYMSQIADNAPKEIVARPWITVPDGTDRYGNTIYKSIWIDTPPPSKSEKHPNAWGSK